MKITIIQHTDGYSVDLKSMIADIDRLEAENARYREALKFIAHVSGVDPASSWAEYHAREALKGE